MRTYAFNKLFILISLFILLVSACNPLSNNELGNPALAAEVEPDGLSLNTSIGQSDNLVQSFTPRPQYQPGELVDYTAQPGDTLAALATRFNTSVNEILAANTFIPSTATTMPPGMPMQIPIYYLPMWGPQYQILPDSLYGNGPAQSGFDIMEYVAQYPGWLNGYKSFVSGSNRSGAEIVELVAQNYSLSPRLLLSLLEYQSGALSQPADTADLNYPMGYTNRRYRGLYNQLAWTSNLLNNTYYRFRLGTPIEFNLQNGRIERPDPWQNAATVALHALFLELLTTEKYNFAISPDGFTAIYTELFSDPWQDVQAHIPGSLTQPGMQLPFERGTAWTFTGGPHPGWGTGEPWAAIDFAPPAVRGGCQESKDWVTAVAPGVITRSDVGVVELDLDGDGDPHTGWTVFYLHIGSEDRATVGTQLDVGDRIGHPSCEGGSSTGTHVHLARKYNGEWITADGTLAFDLEGWVVYKGNAAYQGTLQRFSQVVKACECSNLESQIIAEE